MNSNPENIKIVCEENCGNAPKKELLRDFHIALVKKDLSFCLEWLREDIVWNFIGNKHVQGIEAVTDELHKLMERQVSQLTIHHIITHGNTASVNGILQLDEGQRIAFCDVYQFGGFGKKAKIKEIMSYVIMLS